MNIHSLFMHMHQCISLYRFIHIQVSKLFKCGHVSTLFVKNSHFPWIFRDYNYFLCSTKKVCQLEIMSLLTIFANERNVFLIT